MFFYNWFFLQSGTTYSIYILTRDPVRIWTCDHTKYGEIMTFLKEEHGFTHAFPNFIALKLSGADAATAANIDE